MSSASRHKPTGRKRLCLRTSDAPSLRRKPISRARDSRLEGDGGESHEDRWQGARISAVHRWRVGRGEERGDVRRRQPGVGRGDRTVCEGHARRRGRGGEGRGEGLGPRARHARCGAGANRPADCDEIRKHTEDYARDLSLEHGKPISEARPEVSDVIPNIRWQIET